MTKILRREALAGGAAGVAAVAVGAGLAKAATGDDAELRRLFSEWLAQLTRYSQANRTLDRAEGEARRTKKRQGVRRLKAIAKAEVATLLDLESEIEDTPAEGLVGIGIKLAPAMLYHYFPEEYRDPVGDPLTAAHADLVRMTGIDFAALAHAADEEEGQVAS